MNKTKIEWCDYTWNPVVGCKHGCSYCYAKKICNRFKMIPKFEEPKFYPERINDPLKKKEHSTIFVVSMGDLFGEWVPAEWIKQVLSTTWAAPGHKFMFLTKNPKRYKEFEFPENCWLGATITGEQTKEDWPRNLKNDIIGSLYGLKNKTFLSIEPLLGQFWGHSFTGIDQVIIGAMTGPGAVKPEKHWIESITHDNILYKSNIKPFMKDA